jgi:putative addiction module CopG family antidote
MAVELSPEDKKTAEDWVAAGRFESVDEVVHAGMQYLRDKQEWNDYASDRIDAGLADIEAGRTVPGDEFMAWLDTFHTKPV